MVVSPGSVEDVPRVAALYRACFDDRVITVAGIRHRQVSARPEDELRFWRAEDGGELIGWSFAGRDAFAAARTTANAAIVVHPAHRRGGVGSALWEVVSGHLEAIGARRIVVYSRADDGLGRLRQRPRLQPREHRHHLRRRPANAPAAAGTTARDRDCADGGVRGRPNAGVRGRQGKRSRRARPGRFLGHHVRNLAPPDLGRAGQRPRPERRRDRRRRRRRNVVPLLGSRDGTGDERRYRRDPRLPRPGPRAPDEAALARAGGRLRDHEGDHPERRDQRPDARDQRKLGYAPLSSGHAWVLER